ncbi:MAG TPA: hypothetical protein VKP00_07125, partial [Gemmatimonadaceae bacterium]|nr:hypothetical protein [Gemmatimonadaceae bacterium]
MSLVYRIIMACAAATSLAQPAIAQRGAAGRPTRIPATPPKAQAKADSAKKAAAGVSLDFQDQELRVVLDALAAAGDLNVSMTNIPSQRVSLHMGRPVTREGMVDLVKTVAESNGLKVTETPTLLQIAGTPPSAESRQTVAQQLLAQQLVQNQQQQVRLYTFRLKHASAVQLAPVLTNLFSGLATNFGGRATTIIPNAGGGFQVFTPANPAGGPPGNITSIQPPFAVNPGAGRGGAGRGAAGAAGAAGNPNVAGNVATAINSALAQAVGLSGQSGDIRIIAEESSNSLLVRA